MLKIWGRANSSNVQKVLWCARELGLAWDRVDVGGAFGGNKTPEYLALNPNGVVPTVQDGPVTVWESNAVVRYLAARYGEGGLWPRDPAQRAAADQWMDWKQTTLAPAIIPLFVQLIRTPADQRDPKVVEGARLAAADLFARLDRWLAGRRYVAGDALTMGDIPVGVMTHRWFVLPIERPAAPNLEAWFNRLQERPAYRELVMPPLT